MSQHFKLVLLAATIQLATFYSTSYAQENVFRGHYYLLTSRMLTWTEAEAEAKELGGHLVTVNSVPEELFLQRTFGTDQGFWIGLNDVATEGEFVWANGEETTYRNWAIYQPDNWDPGQHFVRMNTTEFGDSNARKWDDESPLTRLFGIIEVPTTPTKFRGNTYLLTSGTMSWPEAQAEAEALGGNLVTINSALEEEWIRAAYDIAPLGGASGEIFWIGINDAETEGEFVWVSGQDSPYRSWKFFEPNDWQTGQDYGTINRGAGWDDDGSASRYRGIIEIGGDNGLTSPAGSRYELTSFDRLAGTGWVAAQAIASSRGGNLVTINSAAEDKFIRDLFGETDSFWIGINDATSEGSFEWVSGEPVTYTNWGIGQPDDFGGDQDYGSVGTSSQQGRVWSDVNGSIPKRGIVEIATE